MDLSIIESIKNAARKQFYEHNENGNVNLYFGRLRLPRGLVICGVLIDNGVLYLHVGDETSFVKVNARALTNWTGRKVLRYIESLGCEQEEEPIDEKTLTFKHAFAIKGIGLVKKVKARMNGDILTVITLSNHEIKFDTLSSELQREVYGDVLYYGLIGECVIS